jgi:ADP-L-glycero-D-manno-heptose 6-epimerase
MKILVTGHRGFIGSNLYDFLSKKHDVSGFEWGEKFPGYDFDWIIHLGAISSTTETDVEKIMIQNYDFSVNLLKNCIKNKVNLQYASSASVYGHNKEFKEDSKVDPKTPYAWSKYFFDLYLSKRKFDIIVQGFRYFNVYGPGEEKKGDQASPYHKFKKQYVETGKIKVFENSQNYLRDFIHVEKVCETHEKFLSIKESGLWNLGTGQTKSFLDVALSIAPIECIEYVPMPENLKNGYQKYTCADLSKLNNTLYKYSL